MPSLLPKLKSLACWLLGLLALLATSESAQGQTYYLDLSAQTLAVPGRAVYVERVLDGRAGQPAIGSVFRGLENRTAAVLFRYGLEPEMTALLQGLAQRPTDHAVVLCVRQLRVGEELGGFTELASADLAADAYVHLPDGYHFVRGVADRTSRRALETTALHARHVAQLLENCLLQLAGADWAQAARRPARTLAQLRADSPLTAARPAILRAAEPSRGIYHSFEAFLDNRPDLQATLRLDTLRSNATGWEGTTQPVLRARDAAGSRVPAREMWGFSDGHQAYVRQRNAYRALTRQSDFFTFVGPAPLDVVAANQRAQSYATTGALGAMMRGGEDNTGQPIVYALDLRTGQAAPFLSASQTQRPDTAFVYVYRPLGGPAEAQRLLLDDREVAQLRPGEYLELAWPYFGRPMRLSIGTPGGPALLAAPSTATANYVRLQAGAALTPWRWMPTRQGEAEVDALEKQARR